VKVFHFILHKSAIFYTICNKYIAIIALKPFKINKNAIYLLQFYDWSTLMAQKIKQDISLGNNIRKLRKQLKLTQEQVVARLQLQGIEISRSSYSQIERGTYKIRVSELIALAELFQVDYNTFFENL